MELIDGLEVIDKYFVDSHNKELFIDASKWKYFGIEISELLYSAALDLHSNYNVEMFKTTSLFLEKEFVKNNCALFDLGVSSYVFTSSDDFAHFLNLFEMSYFRAAFSKEETFLTSAGSKSFIYFSLKEVIAILDQPLFYVCEHETENPHWFDKAGEKSVTHGFFVCGDENKLKETLEFSLEKDDIKQFFKNRKIDLARAETLLG